ncbi:MAG: thioredoxin family protein [Armatimonadota bacterium]
MTKWWKIAVVAVLVIAVAVVIAKKRDRVDDAAVERPSTVVGRVEVPAPSNQVAEEEPKQEPAVVKEPVKPAAPAKVVKEPVATAPKRLPKLIEFGSTGCMPCKMMAPIIDKLEREYKGSLVVEFVDISENREAAAEYGVRAIPTQVFLDESGKEFSRHLGFFPKEDILATFNEHGIELERSNK